MNAFERINEQVALAAETKQYTITRSIFSSSSLVFVCVFFITFFDIRFAASIDYTCKQNSPDSLYANITLTDC